MFSKSTQSEINYHDSIGAPKEELKKLYMKRNSFEMDLDRKIYRIFGLAHLMKDIEDGVLTHIKVCPEVWDDDKSENPLLNKIFQDVVTGGVISIKEMMLKFYALCWTSKHEETADDWISFAHSGLDVRVQTTPRKLLNSCMNLQDTYEHHHYIGDIQYLEEDELKEWVDLMTLNKLLTSQGEVLVDSILRLHSSVVDVQEVRLIYNYFNGDEFVKSNVLVTDSEDIKNGLCHIPFKWDDIIESVTIPHRNSENIRNQAEDFFKGLGLDVTIKSSAL